MSTPGSAVQRALAVFILCLLTLRLSFSWPVASAGWGSQLVNSSSLCTDPAIEDLNPEDPAILQFSRKPEQQKASFLQHVHSLLGRSLDLDGRPQARTQPPCTSCISNEAIRMKREGMCIQLGHL